MCALKTWILSKKNRTVKGKMITNHNASKLGPLGLLDFQTDLSRCGFRLIYHRLSSIYGLFIPVAPLSSGKRAHPVRSTHYWRPLKEILVASESEAIQKSLNSDQCASCDLINGASGDHFRAAKWHNMRWNHNSPATARNQKNVINWGGDWLPWICQSYHNP